MQTTKLLPGDHVRFKRGSQFRGTLTITHSGTADAYIVLTDYGDAREPAPAFTNRAFDPAAGDFGNCIRLKGSFIRVENLYFHETVAGLSGRIGFETMWELGAVYIDKTARQCVVRNNEFVDCGVGIKSYGEGADIRARFEETADSVLAQVRATPGDWTWSYHHGPDELLANRRGALEAFLTDFGRGMREGRYIVAELPSLPFGSGSFGVAVCSHLLFLYSDLLSTEFHVRSVRELCRVAREVRLFPLLTLHCEPSPHTDAVRAALAADGWVSEVVRVDYELQRGGNEMLRLFRA